MKTYNYLLIESRKANKEFDAISPAERHKDSQQANARGKCVNEKNITPDSFNYGKEETAVDSTDGANHFYTQGCAGDGKLMQKQTVPPYDGEQVPLTIYNDISQKLMQKQQNGSSSPKIDNRYDKKLNQFNLKPSVSNVFSSLNDYINAPPGSSDCIHSVLDEQESDVEHKAIRYESEAPQLIQSTAKDADKSVVIKQPPDAISASREASIPVYLNLAVPATELPGTLDGSVEEGITDSRCATDFEGALNETELSRNITAIRTYGGLQGEAEAVNEMARNKYSFDRVHETTDVTSPENNLAKGEESAMQLEESKRKLDMESSGSTDEHESSLNPVHKPLGFSNIDNLSEDELTRYLAELEEEEKLNEASNKYEDASICKPYEAALETAAQSMSQNQNAGDEGEVRIFKDVVAESPEMIHEKLNDEAESVPAIDYKSKEADKEVPTELLEKESPQHGGWEKEDNHSDILDTSSKEFMLLNTDKDVEVKREDTCVFSENDVPQHCTYDLNINRGSLGSDETEVQLKEQKGNPARYGQACELKMQGTTDDNSDEKNSATSETRVANDEPKHSDDAMPQSLDISTRSNTSDTSDESEKPVRPQTLDIALPNNEHQTVGSASGTLLGQEQSEIDGAKEDQGSSPDIVDNSLPESNSVLGKQPPFWVPDSDAPSSMLCDVKFTVLKRRHHCRACGKVLCNKCCSMKYKLEYQGNIDSRVCVFCYQLLTKGTSHDKTPY